MSWQHFWNFLIHTATFSNVGYSDVMLTLICPKTLIKFTLKPNQACKTYTNNIAGSFLMYIFVHYLYSFFQTLNCKYCLLKNIIHVNLDYPGFSIVPTFSFKINECWWISFQDEFLLLKHGFGQKNSYLNFYVLSC